MPAVAIPDTHRVAVTLRRGDEQLVNVWHVSEEGIPPLDATEREDMRWAIGSFYELNETSFAAPNRGINHWIDPSVTVESVISSYLDVVPYTDPEERFPNQVGTGPAADILPLQTALVVSLRTGVSSRRGRGRIFLGGFNEGANEENAGDPRPSDAFLTDVLAALGYLQDRLTVVNAGLKLAVASRADGASRPVTQFRMRNVWSTQRRRAKSVSATGVYSVAT